MWLHERKRALFLAATLWVIYLITYSGLLHSVDEQSLLAMGETMLTGRGWHVNQLAWEQAWLPPQSAPGIDGNLYVYKRGFLLTILALPLFALGKSSHVLGAVQSTMLLGPFLSALTGYFLFRALCRMDVKPTVAAVAVLGWGLATPAFPYARMLFTEPTAALCMTVAFDALLAWRKDRKMSGRLVLAGSALGLLFVNKLANVVVIPVFGAYVLFWLVQDLRNGRSWRAVLGNGLAVGMPILVGLGLAVAYNIASFGTLLATPFSGDEGFTTPLWIGLSGLLFSPGKGLIWYAPLVWLLIPGLWLGLHQPHHRAERLLALGVFVTLLGLYASWFDWAGGRAWGPRFLVPTLPLLMTLITPTLSWLTEPQRLRRWTVAAILVLSVGTQLPGALTNPSVEEARLLSSVSTQQMYWRWQDSPILFNWQAMLNGRFEPLMTQPRFWQQPLAWVTVAAAGLALIGIVVGWHDRRRRAPILAAVGALALTVLLPLTANGDPRWHETSSDPAENAALWAFLREAGHREDVVLLDLIPYFDIVGRTSIWMDRAPMPPSYIGWQRQPQWTDADQARLARWLRSYARVWLSLQGTPAGAPDSITEQWLDDWGYRGEERWFGTQRLVMYGVPNQNSPLWQAGPFSSEVIGLNKVTLRTGQDPLSRLIELDWQTVDAPSLRFSLQVLDAQGQLVTQIDRTPASANAEDDSIDRLGVTLPQAEATLILKLYDAATGQPIPWQVDGSQREWLTLAAE